jgi:hypothetical protein
LNKKGRQHVGFLYKKSGHKLLKIGVQLKNSAKKKTIKSHPIIILSQTLKNKLFYALETFQISFKAPKNWSKLIHHCPNKLPNHTLKNSKITKKTSKIITKHKPRSNTRFPGQLSKNIAYSFKKCLLQRRNVMKNSMSGNPTLTPYQTQNQLKIKTPQILTKPKISQIKTPPM